MTMTIKRFLDYLCVGLALALALAFLSYLVYGNFVMFVGSATWTGGQVLAIVVAFIADFVIACLTIGTICINLPGSLERLITYHEEKEKSSVKKTKQTKSREDEPTTF